ncbi:MAG: hypothetical protein AAF985_14760 [Bacteroidota bacterium]
MNLQRLLLIAFLLLGATGIWSQNRIQINIPTVEEETQYIWRNIQDISFFEQHNYALSLPPGSLLEQLKNKAKNNQLRQEDYEELLDLMRNEVYDSRDYQDGYQKIEDQRDLINKMINRIDKCKRDWPFKAFDTYQINLTLYGPGGSYHPDDGSILIFTTPQGQFKQYDNPANTIIHEMIHIGIEASIIQQLKVPHPLKERIVDLYVQLNFHKELPDYRIQNMGDKRIDQYLNKKKQLKHLHQIIETFMKENQQ